MPVIANGERNLQGNSNVEYQAALLLSMIDYVKKLVGIDHGGIGSDLRGMLATLGSPVRMRTSRRLRRRSSRTATRLRGTRPMFP